ncbi:MAG: DMT family transporter [Myxococcota bacterium]|nr:DMT family transporter [Myxococcota bacterium]
MIGELSALSASALWAGASIIYTRLRSEISAPVLNLFKTASAGGLLWLTLWAMDGVVWPTQMSLSETGWLALSGILGLAIGDTFLFEAFGRIGPRRTLLISALAPAFTAVMAWPILGEPMTLTMVVGICLTGFGVTVVVAAKTPRTETASRVTSGYAFAMVAAAAQASGCIATKLGGAHSPLELTVVRVAFGTLGLLCYLSLRIDWRAETARLKKPHLLKPLIIAMLIGTYLGIWLQVAGLRYAPAGIAASLSSTSPLFVIPLAALCLGDAISKRAALGASLAVIGIFVLCVPSLDWILEIFSSISD